MAIVRTIGQGYYGIEAEGVTISAAVKMSIDNAFRTANSIPSEKLNIRLSDQGGSSAEPVSSGDATVAGDRD